MNNNYTNAAMANDGKSYKCDCASIVTDAQEWKKKKKRYKSTLT